MHKQHAFDNRDYWRLRSFIEAMRQALLASLCCEEFTHDDYYDLFIPPHLHSAMKVMREVSNDKSYSGAFAVEWPHVSPARWVKFELFTHHDVVRPFMLENMELQPSASVTNVERVTELVAERLKVNIATGRLLSVVNTLNEYCKTPSQVRFLWPQITVLAEGAKCTTLVEKLRTKPRSIPSLPANVRKACQTAAATVTQYQLTADAKVRAGRATALTLTLEPFEIEEDGLNIEVKP